MDSHILLQISSNLLVLIQEMANKNVLIFVSCTSFKQTLTLIFNEVN